MRGHGHIEAFGLTCTALSGALERSVQTFIGTRDDDLAGRLALKNSATESASCESGLVNPMEMQGKQQSRDSPGVSR